MCFAKRLFAVNGHSDKETDCSGAGFMLPFCLLLFTVAWPPLM